MKAWTILIGASAALACAIPAWGGDGNEVSSTAQLPAEWLASWSNPSAADRPRQMVHGIGGAHALPEGMPQVINDSGPDALMLNQLALYKDRGLGGVVCNVAYQDYLRSEANWKTLARAIDTFAKLGMVVWIYDEEGYPSGGAGGLVLKENRQYEATELAFDPSQPDPFIIRPAYEFTHASNNYFGARRYINLIDDRAVQCFLSKTHDAYYKWLGPQFGPTVQAVFTDEPSLITIDLGELKRNVIDPIDPAVRRLPAVPWCYDLPERFQQRYQRDLLPLRRSLFADNSPEDREVRRQYWTLVADLVAERYFGAIQTWCADHHIASSGHLLWEEALIHHVPLEGNGLKCLGRMDIPGLDMLNSNPEQVIHDGWLTACLPASAAILNGRRRVMTEVSDFSQIYGGGNPAALPEMQATAAWQAAWGVTEFNLYYSPTNHSAEQFRAYCDYVGRLNAILMPAQLAPKVLLYYPICDLSAEYLPTAERLQLESQSPRAQQIVRSFMGLGQSLQKAQIPFTLIDHEILAAAHVEADGKISIQGHTFETIVVPDGVELPAAAAGVVEQLRQQNGRVLAGPWDAARMSSAALAEAVQPSYRIAPACPTIALGTFVREGRSILLAVNVGQQPYEGLLAVHQSGSWQIMDPADGATRPAKMRSPDQIQLSLAPRQALLFVQSVP